jgi:hypothetical protein
LFEQLYAQGLELIARRRKKMKNSLLKLKNICQIEHLRHRSRFNFLVNLLVGLVAYSYYPMKPSLDLNDKGFEALTQAIF